MATDRAWRAEHADEQKVTFWLNRGVYEQMKEVLEGLGYPSVSEWGRAMARETLLRAEREDTR